MALNTPIRDWHGRTVWLIGASSGIGRATASALHARGARVVVSARNRAALQAFAEAHGANASQHRLAAEALPLDVSDAAAVLRAAHSLLDRGPLHHVVYCAAHYREARATDFDLAEMIRHEQINLVGALHVLAAVLPPMVAASRAASGLQAAHVSLIASVAGYGGLPRSLAYGPTKAALINLAECLYLDLQESGIGVSLINPGFVQTPLTAGNDFTMPALMNAPEAAQRIVAGWERGDFEIHFPRRFTRWMKVLRMLPYPLYFFVVKRFTGL